MESFIYLDDFKVQVHKIVELLNSYTITQRVEAFNYFFTNINFVFPLFSNENCFIEPNLKISLVLLPTSSNEAKPNWPNHDVSTADPIVKQESVDKHLISAHRDYQSNILNFRGSFWLPRFFKNTKRLNLNSFSNFKIPSSSIIETRKLIHSKNNLHFSVNFQRLTNIFIQFSDISRKQVLTNANEDALVFKYDTIRSSPAKRIKDEKTEDSLSEDSDEFNYPICEEIKEVNVNQVKSKRRKRSQAGSCDEQKPTSKSKIFNCLQCGKIYRKKNSLITHSYHHHPGWCPTCGKYYGSTAKDLGDHNRKYHIKDYPHICEECGESFKRRQQFLVHVEVHKKKKLKFEVPSEDIEKRKSFKCNLCSLEFKGFRWYEKHIQEGHKLEGFICEHCGARFKEKLNLHQHNFKVHRKELPCPHCDKKFSFKSNLDRHIVQHTESKKSYICEQCGASYYTPMSLKEHFTYAHKEMKEFICETCNKAFSAKRAWQRHQIVHSDERPFNCNLCSRTFKIKSNLVRHKHLTHKQTAQPNKLKRFVKNDKGELIPVEEDNVGPPNVKLNTKEISNKPNNNSFTTQLGPHNNEAVIDGGNFMQIMGNNMQYQECTNTQNIEIIQIGQNYNTYSDNHMNNNISTMILQANQNHDDFGNGYNQPAYNMQEEWNNVDAHNQIESYSLVEVNSDSLMSLHMKSSNRNDNQIMDISNVELLHYPDIWSTTGTTNVNSGPTNIEYSNIDNSHHHQQQTHQPPNSYNIGSILTNLEMMDNQNNINEINLNMQNSTGTITTSQLNYNDHHHVHHHHHHHDQHLDQSHLNYDFNSQNHTITDISNTFIKETDLDRSNNDNASEDVNNCNKNNMMTCASTSNDVIESIGLNSKQIKEMLQNTNENVMLPSLLDYLQHPYQF